MRFSPSSFAAGLYLGKVVCVREPSWHRRLRLVRQRARNFLRLWKHRPLTTGARKKFSRAVAVLSCHHTWNLAEQSWRTVHFALTMDWLCKKCQIRHSVSKEHCSKCGQHWSKVWANRTPRRRERSKSSSQAKAPPKTAEAENELAVFAGKTPWVATTPNTRVSQVTTPQSREEAAPSEPLKPDMPPEPVLPTPPVPEDETKMLEHLRGLKQALHGLPQELDQKLQELEAKQQSQETKLSHGQLNKMGKVQRQITTLSEKIVKLDQDWQTFVSQVEERFRKHKGLFLSTRTDLLQARKEKVAELEQIKAEISRASQTLLNSTVVSPCEVIEVDDMTLMESLQQAAAPLEELDDYPDPGEEDTEMEAVAADGKAVIQPLLTPSNSGVTYQSGQGPSQTQGRAQAEGGRQKRLGVVPGDVIAPSITIPVRCCIDDVFAGSWSWTCGDDELHYTKVNLGLRSGAYADASACCSDDDDGWQHDDLGPSSSLVSTVPVRDGRDGTDLAHGENVANNLSTVAIGRQVRFHPVVEVREFELVDEASDFDVDDVIPPVDDPLEAAISRSHFESEATDGFTELTADVEPIPAMDDIVEEEDDPYVILHGFEVLETSTLGATISDDEPMKIITYGIRGQSLGRRDTWLTVPELPRLRHAVWELWQDAVPQFGACWAFAVRPQPLAELQASRAWILVVEIAPGEATPPGYCAVLMMTCSQITGLMGRAYPKLVREETSVDALVAQHTYSRYCIPTGLRVCHLAVEGASLTPHEAINVRPGALSKLTLGEATPSFEEVHVWHPHAEDLAIEALALHRAGLESFQLVLHTAGHEPRELNVDVSAFTAPHGLRRILPLDVVRGRLLWLPMTMLYPTMGVRSGRFHFVIGAQRPGPERPILVLSCRATAAYYEQWHHEVRWIAHGTSMADFIAGIFPDVARDDISSVSMSSNQVPITTIHDVGAGDSVVAYLGRSMSSEGLPGVEEDEDLSLMQLPIHGDLDPSTFSAHVVLQHLLPIWRGYGPARDVFQRRTLHLLNQRFPAHQLFSWARIATPLWNGEYSEVDILIRYPRPLGAVDIVVEFVDMARRHRLEEPVIFRVLVPLTSWALSWSLQQHFHYEPDWQVGVPMVNGRLWNADAATRQFYDGDVVTIFLQDGASVNDVCVVTPSDSSDDYSGSEHEDVELQVVTILQTGDGGEDQRFDMLAPWQEPIMATLQWCIANPLVGWAAPCRSYRRWPWQHRRQVLALAWTDLLDPHTVPVLMVETVMGSELREWHVAYLPVQLRLDDVQFWTQRSGPCEIMDRWRLAHPTIPDMLTFTIGSQVWCRFSAAVRHAPAHGLHLLQTGIQRLRSLTDGSASQLFDPDRVIPAVSDVIVIGPLSDTTSTTDVPDSLRPSSSGTMRRSYTEDNSDLSSGLVDMLPHRCEEIVFDPSEVIPNPREQPLEMGNTEDNVDLNADQVYMGNLVRPATPVVRVDVLDPDDTVHRPLQNYSEDNVDLSAGSMHSPGESCDDRIASLNDILADLSNLWPPHSMSTCYDLIPDLHPIARMICTQQDWTPVTGNCVRYHIYTDGSARRHPDRCAAWAFHVVVESHAIGGPSFHRIGYTGDLVDASMWSANLDSIDAEACAIIFMADWLFSLTHDVDVVVHFDAEAVGCGAFGEQNSPVPAATPREVQHVARVMVSLASARHTSLRWRHIKSHCGQPDNEAVDSIAYALCSGWNPPFHPPNRLSALMAHPLRDWAWLQCNSTEELPDLSRLIAAPPSPPDVDPTLWQVQKVERDAAVTHVKWTFGSANVRTMQYTDRYHSEKVIFLREQLVSMAFDVFAFQECRGRWDQCLEDEHFIRICAAGSRGQGGLELWFRKDAAFKATGLGDISREQLVVWHTSPTVLGVACHHPALVCTIVVIYAPQAGRSNLDVSTWWSDLDAILQRRPHVGPLLVLGDANAHVGSVTTPGISDLFPDFEDTAGEGLRHLCTKHGLLLPSTFAAYHTGPSATFIGPWQAQSRVDYIALPGDWESGIEVSATCPALDLLTDGEDHIAIKVEMTLQVMDKSSNISGRIGRYDRDKARSDVGQERLKSLTHYIPAQPWADDVNKHWHNLRTAVLDTCGWWFPKPKRKRRQIYMSDRLWGIVEDRKELASRLKQLGQRNRLRSLAGFFALWTRQVERWRELCVQEVLADQVYALDLLQYQQLSCRFHAIRKQERKQWILHGAQQLQSGLSQGSFSQWCKLLKPKRAIQQKSRPHGRLPGVRNVDGTWMSFGQNVSLMWQRHFGKIENAEDGTPEDILSRSTPTSIASVDRLLEMPTIYDVERAIRLSNPYKAPGPDQIGAEIWRSDVPGLAKRCYALFLKSGLRSQWVAEFAGGDLVPLHKKGDTTQPSNYRAILLEPTLGRIFSRAWRTRLVSALQLVQAPMQFGGHRVVSIEVAHLAVRNAQAISHARRMSCAMIFADIRSAFYVVAKPFLTGDDTSPEALTALFDQMGLPQDALAAFIEAIEEGVLIPEIGPSNHLQSVVAAMLRHTWAKVPGADRYMLPRTGSRPGDPLADALFGFVMARALHAIARRYDAEGLCTTWDGDTSLAPAVVWSMTPFFILRPVLLNCMRRQTVPCASCTKKCCGLAFV